MGRDRENGQLSRCSVQQKTDPWAPTRNCPLAANDDRSDGGQVATESSRRHAFLDGHPSGDLTHDRIVDNITLYWLTNTATSSARLYWENFRTVAAAIASGQKPPKLSLPVAYTVFHGEVIEAPSKWAKEVYPNQISCNQVDKRGHFAAWEEPELFSKEVRAAFAPVR
jgi:hypothetical protein